LDSGSVLPCFTEYTPAPYLDAAPGKYLFLSDACQMHGQVNE
jgi:hypothetical protein